MEDISFLLSKEKTETSEILDSLEHFEGEISSISQNENHTYRFNTPTVREVIYNSILKKNRRELHNKYANWIYSRYKENYDVIERLAYHFINGTDIEKAILFSKLSGEKSRNYFANESGIKYFSDALRLLKKTETTNKTDKMKLECFRRQGYFLMMTGDLKNALLNQKRALKLANKLSSEQDRTMSLLNIGMLYDKMEEPKKPMRYYRKAKKVAEQINLLSLVSMAENNIGLHQKKCGEFKKALRAFNRSLKITRTLKNPVEEAVTIQNIGEVYDLLGLPKKALKKYELAMKMLRDLDVKERIPALCVSISVIHSIMGNLQKAKKYANDALDLSREIGDVKTEKDSLGNLGIILFRMNQPTKAIELYNNALSMAEKMNDLEHQMALFINIGEVFHTVGDFENAIEYHKKAKEIAEQIKQPMGLLEATKWLAMDYYYLEQFEDALRYFRILFERSLKMKDKKYSSLSETLMGFIDKNVDSEKSSLRLKNALDVSRQIGDVDMALTLFKEAARYLTKKKDLENALANASMVLKFSEQLGSMRERAWALYLMSECNRGLENAEWETQLKKASEIASNIKDGYLSSLINSSYGNK